jgi:hypothetical protein
MGVSQKSIINVVRSIIEGEMVSEEDSVRLWLNQGSWKARHPNARELL